MIDAAVMPAPTVRVVEDVCANLVHDATCLAVAPDSFDRSDVIVSVARPDAFADPARRRALLTTLSPEESERVCRFRFDGDRLLFLVAHALVRMTLSRYSHVTPRAWQFRAAPHGRSEIAAPRSPLRFNLSHTRGLAVCALAWERDVGVDVERIPDRAALDVAEQFFAAGEVDDLHRTPGDRRARRFVEYWTLKEAYVKARGLGLSLPLSGFSMHDHGDGAWRVSFNSPSQEDPARWRFTSAEIAGTHQVAVAVTSA